jgi:radical SAM protein with 4Fe4S-binding SPASM domain
MSIQIWPTQLENATLGAVFSDVPQVVGIEITGRCQLRCRHCYNRSGPDKTDELPLEVIERLLDEMIDWGVSQLRVSGGEPTVHRQFRDVIDACKRRQITVAINTNGIYSSEMLLYLQAAPISLFLISVDGLESNNDAIRGSGVFRRAINSCTRLHQAGQNVMISCHVGAGNRADVGGLIALAGDIGVGIKFTPIRPVGRAVDELPRSLIRPEDYFAVVQTIVQLRSRYSHIPILTDFDITDGPPDNACQRDPGAASCKAGRTMVNISYDGGIYACGFFVTSEGEFSAGNIYSDTVTDVWKNSPVFEPFRVHQKSTACQSCAHYQRRCAGGCPAISHFTTGHLDALDPVCFADLIEPPEGDPA